MPAVINKFLLETVYFYSATERGHNTIQISIQEKNK
jgi:hypothetical protein